ncbi:23S rRNA (pseudouridine(1915)-N(3))-methyltransferase RlmH [Helicobacter turcicus]|uniref:Ribosomal RNA large subunit methyltransferase H n=1 Tax=Helicobacter turcicus TaxID=2867412 RepID=A0ABS7JLH6_9HELI|nr:23S rRNA (pseudouridine(1915)-N(3))-methyltransferase RlmH [Helicobacter turcicus]MBX7490239.1 23S rRNA (pseudouridine(1915)-N(3))-methyltransferase RlmH [Helicobacter turcicus]MBX7545182.1 23S rRNA (pseudouridine(1915)-N(3))-methyltransferase RlmH [Helicobacter turcicus]
MIKVNIYYIAKNNKDLSTTLCNEFATLCANFGAKIEFINLFSKHIKESQKQEPLEAQKSYTQAFLKVLKQNTYKIALTPNARTLDSFAFAKILQDKGEVAFFIGGAYGLEENFTQNCNTQISLSPLTFSHKITKVVLSEQIYRAFCLLNNHPYHK